MEADGERSGTWAVTNSFVIPLSAIAMGEAFKSSGKSFICSFPECDASFNKSWKLEAHLCKHTGVKPFVCTQDGCDKRFTRSFHLTRHQLSHSGEKPVRCTADGCDAAFTTTSNLKKHMARKHERQEKQYTCEYEGCGKSFKKNSRLKIHQYEHTNLLPFKCNHEGCEKSFPVPSKLKRHEKVHMGYPCKEEGCPFLGKTWTEFMKHKRTQHIELLQCDQCSRSFKSAWFLQQHQYVHQAERAVLRCPHQGCPRTYTTAFNLQSHILSFHEEQRPHACPHPGCGKTFAMRQSLQRHGVVHDPEKKKLKKTPRPKRSLASKLSGYKASKKASAPEPASLATLLQNTTLEQQPSTPAPPPPEPQ
ncbi:TF3A factor, partial [Amia calva]|nr:TF3A factor [Amia calva]